MSILIKDMELPPNCEECDVKAVCKKYWKLIREQHTRPSWCPLVVLSPHGRLIDADEFLRLCEDYAITPSDNEFCKRLKFALTRAATIVEAEENEQ